VRLYKRFLSHRPLLISGSLIIVIGLVAIFAPYIAPMDPYKMDVKSILKPPSREHLFGTDQYGRDLFSRVIFGSRISLQVGMMVAVFTSICGGVIGLIAGYFRTFDNMIMRLMDALMSIPALLLAIVLMAVFGASSTNAVLALTIVYTPRTSRVVRSAVLTVREQPYVEAARALGMGTFRILFRHVLPNSFSPLIVQGTLVLSYAIISEVSLSFIGVGAPPPTPSWGNTLSSARTFLKEAPWMSLFPGAAIVTLVTAVNLFGDALRDILSPRFRD